ncbi:MAG: acyl-CoA dehydrogenase family protein, partial [Mycobacteriaceae bacterium]
MSVATTDEQRAVQESIRSWASKTQPLAAVRSAELEHARAEDVWSEFTGLGFLAVALPEECGGVGGSMVDLAAIVEEAASAMVPGPIVGTVLAGQLLARSGAPVAQKLLPALAEGQLPCAVALDAGALTAERARDGGILVTGTVGPVQGADDVSTLVLAARSGTEELWFVLDAGTSGVQVTQRKSTDLTRTVADLRLEQVSVSADRLLGGVRSTLVLDLAATLFAAECAGVAGWCLRTAADYARVREQFGKPIGSFQAIKHLCAEMLCRE